MSGTGGDCCCQPDNPLGDVARTIRLTTANISRVGTVGIQALLSTDCSSVTSTTAPIEPPQQHQEWDGVLAQFLGGYTDERMAATASIGGSPKRLNSQ